MMMMMSTFTAGESINLYAKCAEGGGGGGLGETGDRKST